MVVAKRINLLSLANYSHVTPATQAAARQMFICVCPGNTNARRRGTYTLYMHSAEKDVMEAESTSSAVQSTKVS